MRCWKDRELLGHRGWGLDLMSLGGDQVQGVALGGGLCSAVGKVTDDEENTAQRPECGMFTRTDRLSEEAARPGREEIL